METPITFGTDGWRATLDTFTEPRVRIVGQAVADYLDDEDVEGAVGVCYDARETSPGFADALAETIAARGRDVVLTERDRPTPLLAYGIVDRDLAGGLMVTASHNPPEYNGVKFIPDNGAPALPEVTDAIMERLREPDPLPEDEHGEIEEVDFREPHFRHAAELVDADLSGLTVAYDAMHGSGRNTTDALLARAGASVRRLRCTDDPTFGGETPEPAAEHLTDLVEMVTEGEADIGVANDGDADRLAIVTSERGFLDENLFFAALYDYLLESDSGPAVRSVPTTFLVDRIAEAHGEEVHETAVGFKWIAQAFQEHDALVGGEESGGFTVRGHVPEKDGVLMSLLAAAMETEEPMDERVDRLLAEHGDVRQSKISVDCPDSEKERVIDELSDVIPDDVAGTEVDRVVTVDGFKLLLADGSWVLVRPSGTEPKLRVYAEGPSDERVDELLEAGREIIEPLV